MFDLPPLLILAIGIFSVVGMIIVLRIHAFLALIIAALIVSILGPRPGIAEPDFIERVALAFGSTVGSIGIIIAMAAVIGKCLIDSGAADRIVRMFLKLLGQTLAPVSLMTSGFILSIPVFFDTVFYLLIPLARSMHRRTGKKYLLLILAMGAGATITHSLVPPTPGPLIIASNLGIDLGMMIMIGLAVSAPTALITLIGIWILSPIMNVPMRSIEGSGPEQEPLPDDKLPGLFISVLPIILPVLLISINTVTTTLADAEHAAKFKPADISNWNQFCTELSDPNNPKNTPPRYIMDSLSQEQRFEIQQTSGAAEIDDQTKALIVDSFNNLIKNRKFYNADVFADVSLSEETEKLREKGISRATLANVEHFNRLVLEAAFPNHIVPHKWLTTHRKYANITDITGNPNLALLISAAVALWVLYRQRKMSLSTLSRTVESALMSGGIIILITSAGGAFGAMLKTAQIGPAIEGMFATSGSQHIAGIKLLLLCFFVAFLIKFAQGSTTVSMITTSAMMASMIASPEAIGFHPVYVACAIGFGAQCGNWMNDSGFWVFAKMGGLTEVEALKSWTVTVSCLAIVGLLITIIFAASMPMTP